MSLSLKIAKNTTIQLVSKVVSTILGLLALGFMTRYLGQAGFGEYTTVINFLSIFAILADFGLTLVTTQMLSHPEANENKIINNLFSLRLVSAIIFLSLAPISVIFFPYGGAEKIGVAIAAASFVFIALNQIFVGLFQKRLTMDRVALAEVSGRLVLLGGIVLTVYYNLGLNGILWVTVLSSVINFLIQWLSAKKFVRVRWDFDKAIWRAIIKKSWPLATTITLNLLYLKTDTLILSLVRPSAEVGIYGSAYKIIDVLVTVPFMFAGVILPLLTANWINKNLDYFKAVFQKSFNFMAILALPLVIGTQFLAKNVMILIAGENFAAGGVVLQILILAAGAIFLNCMFSHALVAIDKQKKIIGAYIFVSVSTIAGYLYFIPKFSYLGAAWMTVYSETAMMLFAMYYVFKNTKMFPKLNIAFKALISALMMAGWIEFISNKLYYNSPWGLILTLLSAIGVYLLVLFLMKGLTKDDFKLFLWNHK